MSRVSAMIILLLCFCASAVQAQRQPRGMDYLVRQNLAWRAQQQPRNSVLAGFDRNQQYQNYLQEQRLNGKAAAYAMPSLKLPATRQQDPFAANIFRQTSNKRSSSLSWVNRINLMENQGYLQPVVPQQAMHLKGQ